MTAAMQAAAAGPDDEFLSPLDNHFSTVDWKAKARELEKILSETRADLQEFQITSKQLEEELEEELDRTEKAQQELQVKAARAEQEKDEWKSKFMSLQTTHNTTTTSLQRELDTLRKDYQHLKVQLRELEMGNDDLERNERAISSSLADVEQKYGRVLEEKILLEQDLYEKANVEEECQRLKDELRDANEEIGVLKEQLAAARDRAPAEIPPSVGPSSQYSDDEDYLSRRLSQEMQLSELLYPTAVDKDLPHIITTTSTPRPATAAIPSALQRAGFQPRTALTISASGIPPPLVRSTTTPAVSTPTRAPLRTPSVVPPLTTRNLSSASAINTVAATRSKGVQMVSEMRARVKVLEQKIHTRVPRIRMGSVSTNANLDMATSVAQSRVDPSGTQSPTASSSKSSSFRSPSPEKTSTLKPKRTNLDRRQSLDDENDMMRTPAGNNSGWVLIMEDSPSPVKDKGKDIRRVSAATAPSSFRALNSLSISQTPPQSRPPSSLGQSHSQIPTGIRRPQSRLSDGRSSISTNATTSTASSIPTPVSRPSTPTFLPVPTSGLYHSAIGSKRPTGPILSAHSPKRPSFPSNSTGAIRPVGKLNSPSRSRTMHSGLTMKKGGGDDFSDAQLKQGRGRASSATFLFGRYGT